MLRLPQQIRHMLIGGFGEAGENFHVLVKLLDELFVFLVPPGGVQGGQLVAQGLGPVAELGGEFFQTLGELPEFLRVDDRLGHGGLRRWLDKEKWTAWRACSIYLAS